MNNDLISRSALLEKALPKEKTSDLICQMVAIKDIKDAPAVDAVEVVRCEKCQYMEIKMGLCYCKVWQGYNGMGGEGFCNYGERKAE